MPTEWRKLIKLGACLGLLVTFGAGLALAVLNATEVSEKDCYRTAAGAPISGTFVRGTSLSLTNWQFWADSTGTTTQDLDGIVLEFTVGTEASAVTYTGTIANAANGQASAMATVPTNTTATIYIEVALIHTNSSITFIYPLYSFITRARLGQ